MGSRHHLFISIRLKYLVSNAMTVKQLIEKLKKFDQNALVAWKDHDQSADEINGYVGYVSEAEDELLIAASRMLELKGATNIVVLSS